MCTTYAFGCWESEQRLRTRRKNASCAPIAIWRVLIASAPFKTWLLTIASNHCIDQLRRRRMTQLSLDDEPTAAYLALASDEPTPEQAAISRETSEEFQQLLAILPDDYRLFVVLRYWYDYSYTEIANMTSSSISAVKEQTLPSTATFG